MQIVIVILTMVLEVKAAAGVQLLQVLQILGVVEAVEVLHLRVVLPVALV